MFGDHALALNVEISDVNGIWYHIMKKGQPQLAADVLEKKKKKTVVNNPERHRQGVYPTEKFQLKLSGKKKLFSGTELYYGLMVIRSKSIHRSRI